MSAGSHWTTEYGERWAHLYDEIFPSFPDQQDCIDALAELAGGDSTGAAGARVLELAIGTGRIALPLIEKGVNVEGVDVSEPMVARLRAKPGGDRVKVTMGDFADVPAEGRFRLVYIVFNTLFALLTQEDQLRCFENVAAHLEPDAAFVLECFHPDLSLFDRGQHIRTEESRTDRLRLTASRLDLAAQRIDSNHLILDEGSYEMLPIHIRFSWPAELDLMARLAGLRLRHRWGGWKGQPFTSESRKHVSIYEPATT